MKIATPTITNVIIYKKRKRKKTNISIVFDDEGTDKFFFLNIRKSRQFMLIILTKSTDLATMVDPLVARTTIKLELTLRPFGGYDHN